MSVAQQKTPLLETQSTPIDPPRRTDGNFLVGDLYLFQYDNINYFLDTGKMSPMMRFRMAHLDNLLVTDADFAKEILQTKNKNYLKEPRLMRILEDGGDKVLFTTDGDEWLA